MNSNKEREDCIHRIQELVLLSQKRPLTKEELMEKIDLTVKWEKMNKKYNYET